jgi:hypothetical protein
MKKGVAGALIFAAPGGAFILGVYWLRRMWIRYQISELIRTARPSIAKMGTFRHYNTGRTMWSH